jgi:hypothetical protein
MDEKFKHPLFLLMLSIVLLTGGCTNLSSMENAGVSYRQNKDYASLEHVCNKLFKGMRREEVERFLGEPEYSPIDGQYYYSSDKSEYSEEQGREVAVGLVIDYRDDLGKVTGELQEYWLGPIAE